MSFQGSALISPFLAEESQAQALCDLVPDLVEQGVSEEIPEDNLEILSLTSPDLEQSLKDAVRFGERDLGQGLWLAPWPAGQARPRRRERAALSSGVFSQATPCC